MSLEEGRDLLEKHLGQGSDASAADDDAKKLLDEPGNIPLAVSHAASYMAMNSITVSDYLADYTAGEENQVYLLQPTLESIGIEDSNDGYSGEDYPVLKAWLVSFSRVYTNPRTGPLATTILAIMSLIQGTDIPRTLFGDLKPGALRADYTEAFGTLKSLSMIQETGTRERTRYSVHRLIQLAMRQWLEQQGTLAKFKEMALAVLSEKFPSGNHENWAACSALEGHAESVLQWTKDTHDVEARAKLLEHLAGFRFLRGEYRAAERMYREAIELQSTQSGDDSKRVLNLSDSLASVLESEGRYEEEGRLLDSVLEKKRTAFGNDSPETLSTDFIQATLLGLRGRHSEAEQLHRRVVGLRSTVLGAEHPDTLQSGAKLGLQLWELGHFADAESTLRAVLSARNRILGPEHPDALDAATTLGFVLESVGRLAEAEELKLAVLEHRKAMLGPNHPTTAGAEHDVAWILHQRGRLAEAGPHYDAALAAKTRLLGPRHPSTLTTRCNVPVWRCDAGEYAAAEEASRAVVADFERVCGPEHPATLDAVGDLAVILRHAGKLDEAEAAGRRSVQGREKVIGPDHPWVGPPTCHLGYVLALKGDVDKGVMAMRVAVAKIERNYGEGHGFVHIGRLQLSKGLLMLVQQQRHALGVGKAAVVLREAETLARQGLEGRQKVLGKEHPDTPKAAWHLSKVLRVRAEIEEAFAQVAVLEATSLHEDAFRKMANSLGLDHPDVIRCGNALLKSNKMAGNKAWDAVTTLSALLAELSMQKESLVDE